MDFVKEHLESQKMIDFGDSQDRPNNIELEILADTVYVRVSWPEKLLSCASTELNYMSYITAWCFLSGNIVLCSLARQCLAPFRGT